mgnify:CR=1 FL=1
MNKTLPCFLLAALAASPALSEEGVANPPDAAPLSEIELEVYDGGAGSPAQPLYPRQAVTRLEEGFVIVNYMIDAEGKPFEIEVAESSNRRFERNAVRAVKNGSYTPATLNGVPLDSGRVHVINFIMHGGVGASDQFMTELRRFHKALQDKNFDRARRLLERLDTGSNLREYRVNQLAHYH